MRALAIAVLATMCAASGAETVDDGAAAATTPPPLPPLRSPDGGIAPPEVQRGPVIGAIEGPGGWQGDVWEVLFDAWLKGPGSDCDPRAAVLWAAFPIITAPAWAPYEIVEGRSYRAEFNAIPYRGGDAGPLFVVGDGHPSGWLAMGRVGAEVGRSIDAHDWTWARAQALADTTWRLGATASLTWFDHAPPVGDGARTVIATGDLLYRIAQHARVQFRAGVGAVALIDDDTGARGVGPDLAYVVDVFPVRPLVLSTTLDVGWVHGQRVAGADVTAGLVVPHSGVEGYVGWRWQHLDHDGVQGVIGGLRWWF